MLLAQYNKKTQKHINMKSFLKRLILVTCCILAVTTVLTLLKVQLVVPIDYCTVVYFGAVTFLAFYLVCKTLLTNPKRFTQTFMLVTFVKLFLHIGVLAGYLYFHRTEPLLAKNFLIFFAAMFVIYLIFETVEMARLVRQIAELEKKQRADKQQVEETAPEEK